MRATSWVNGVPGGCLDLADRGLAYGDGVFETMRVAAGAIPLQSLHVERLRSACKRLSLPVDTLAVCQQIDAIVAGAPEFSGVLKLIITRGAGGRGYLPQSGRPANVIFRLLPVAPYPADWYRNGVKLRLSDIPLAENRALAGIKHLNRLEQVLARLCWRDPGIPDSLMLDTAGRVVEGIISNVFFVTGGQLSTPSVHRCGVAGVMRRHILDTLAPRIDLATTVTDLSLDDFYRADEVFIANSVFGILPVKQLGCVHKMVGPVTARLQQTL